MSTNSLSPKLIKLYEEKRFSDLILEIESTTSDENRSAIVSNLLGVSRASIKGRTDRDVQYSLKDFENSFYKDNLGDISLDALCNHIKVCIEVGKKESPLVRNFLKSEEMYNAANDKFSDNEKFLLHGIDMYKYLVNLKKKIAILEKMIKKKSLTKSIGISYMLSQMYSNNWSQRDFFKFSKDFSKLFKKFDSKKLDKINLLGNKKIKIGFLSPDYNKQHSITYFLKDLIPKLSDQFTSYGLSLLEKKKHDETTNIFQSLFDKWEDLGELSSQAIINKIQELNIHILIDLAGIFSHNRIEIFNTRICPLQINWLGFNNTTGLKEIDYIIADKNTVKEEEKFYTEKVIKLPNIWNAHSGFNLERSFKPLPAKKKGFVTFGSFNSFMKLSDETIKNWIKILLEVKNSKLILKSSLYVCEESLIKKFEKEGLKDSIKILKKTKRAEFNEHLYTYNDIDICLDTYPYNGVTTTFEALWMNVPVITKKGYNFNSRCGESILINANLDNLIASSDEDYFNKAVYFSNNLDELEKLRKNLFENILDTPLFDTKNFSLHFSNKLLEVFKEESAKL